jgi:hypothetical protein
MSGIARHDVSEKAPDIRPGPAHSGDDPEIRFGIMRSPRKVKQAPLLHGATTTEASGTEAATATAGDVYQPTLLDDTTATSEGLHAVEVSHAHDVDGLHLLELLNVLHGKSLLDELDLLDLRHHHSRHHRGGNDLLNGDRLHDWDGLHDLDLLHLAMAIARSGNASQHEDGHEDRHELEALHLKLSLDTDRTSGPPGVEPGPGTSPAECPCCNSVGVDRSATMTGEYRHSGPAFTSKP